MKKRNTLILVFMLVVGGVILLSQTPVLATMNRCATDGSENGICFEITALGINSLVYPIYVVRAVDLAGNPATLSTWPFQSYGRTVFKYKAGTTNEALLAVKNKIITKPSAWSYIVFSLSGLPLDADPPGAQLALDQLHASCGAPVLGSRIAYKLNPSVNFSSRDTTFALYADSGTTYDTCGLAWVVYSSNCAGGSLYVPKLGDTAPVEQFRTFYCEDSGVEVNVEYDLCTSAVKTVMCGEVVANMVEGQTWGYAEVPGCPDSNNNETRTFQILNMGPGPGVTICTGSEQPIFLWGNRAYWCGTPPTTPSSP